MTSKGVAMGGMMGVGKTTAGTLLARELAWELVDTDAVLAQRFGPIVDQVRSEGEGAFRIREAEVVREMCQREGPMVLVTGGGVWADPELRSMLQSAFRTVVLNAPVEILRTRLRDDTARPFAGEIEARLASRQQAYSQAEGQVDASGDLPSVLRELRAFADPVHTQAVDIDERPYPVSVARTWAGLGDSLSAAGMTGERVFLVTDPRVYSHWGSQVVEGLESQGRTVEVCVLDVHEANKDVTRWQQLVDELLSRGVDRHTPVLALGGGVVGDVVGFAASSLLRGLPFVQLPTTLLAAVDSSVGGKTGVNHGGGKNTVGAFHQPRLVFFALDALRTLPRAEVSSGLAEVVKIAAIADPDLLELLEEQSESLLSCDPSVMGPVVSRCVALKAQIVSQDVRDRGQRALLNAGHTVGHGLEAALDFGGIRHGEAVSVGLVLEARWALREGHCVDQEFPDRLERLLDCLGLPTRLPDVDKVRVTQAMRLDKKMAGDNLVLPVPLRSGHYVLIEVDRDDLQEILCP